jgi:hypothetical protein
VRVEEESKGEAKYLKMLQFKCVLRSSRVMDLQMRDSLAEITVTRREMTMAPVFICDWDQKAVMDRKAGRLLHPHERSHSANNRFAFEPHQVCPGLG